MLEKDYQEHYKPLLRDFCQKLKGTNLDFHGIPQLFIPCWGANYGKSDQKIAFIGLETYGWGKDLSKYIEDVLQEHWESSFDNSDFQNLAFRGWGNTRYSFFGFVMYFLAALNGVKNWTVLKWDEKYINILNNFLWGNVSAIERWESYGVDRRIAKPQALEVARNAANELNDFCHMQKLFVPDVTIIMCGRDECNHFLRNTEKQLVSNEDDVRLWQSSDEKIIFNIPHPCRMKYTKGADFFAERIRAKLSEKKLFASLPQFDGYDQDVECALAEIVAELNPEKMSRRTAVANIAGALRKKNMTVMVPTLCDILNDAGYKTTYDEKYLGGRGSYRMVSCTWRYYHDSGKEDVANAIAEAFTKPDGTYAYEC